MRPMPRSTSAIQVEIDLIEARLQSADSFVRSGGSDGAQLSYEARSDLESRLDRLYRHLDRASGRAPMFVRGVVRGLRRG